jgi:hypothetical protein
VKKMSIEVERSHTNRALDFAEKQHELLIKINSIINSKDFKDIPKPDSVSTPIQEFRISVKPTIDGFEGLLKACSEPKYVEWKAKQNKNSDPPIVVY